MNPELRSLLARVAELETAVASLAAEVRRLSAPKPQQLTRPLDTASQLVVKEAMELQGFNYP